MSAPTDQRAGVRPIAFVLQTGEGFGAPVNLRIRPSDLTKTEPSRIAVTQTLGRQVQGWSDNFGQGLPSVTIAGHTGWRAMGTSGMDGAGAFEQLNNLVMKDYHAAKQNAIDRGRDPDTVKLIFVDMLDNFVWSVAPMQFVLRRSRSQPLLFNYNMTLQAEAINLDNPLMIKPLSASVSAGVASFGGVVGLLERLAGNVQGWVMDAIAFKDRLLAPIAGTVKAFYDTSLRVFNAVNSMVTSGKKLISSTANSLIKIAGDIAGVGINIMRTFAAIQGLPGYLKSAIMRVAGAYTEALCILRNSLKPRQVYEQFDGLYGASNCSSTSGGRPASQYINTNAFALMQEPSLIGVSSDAQASISELNRGDVILQPLSIEDIGSKLEAINDGITLPKAA